MDDFVVYPRPEVGIPLKLINLIDEAEKCIRHATLSPEALMRLPAILSAWILCASWAYGSASERNLIARLPLRFERVEGGSARNDTRYVAKGPGYSLEVAPRENVLTLSDPRSNRRIRLYTKLLGRARHGRLEALDELPSRTNYFHGSSSQGWRTNVANYSKVRVDGVYPGVDLVFYGTAGQLEYDFVVHPGADPRAIQFEIQGADTVSVDASGDLLLSAGGLNVRWNAPLLYQAVSGGRSRIVGGFQQRGRRVRFQVGDYDRTRELVIDPVLSYASYLGGSGDDAARAIATDSAGNVYISGGTTSANLAVTATAFQPSFGGQTTSQYSGDAFVAKFSSAGALLYLTYLGGQTDDFATSLAVDAAGNAYVAGMTNSTDFPVTAGAYQKIFAGYGGNTCGRMGDAFVAKLNPTGSELIYSTYLGGQKDDAASAIAIDSTGNVYVAGSTISTDFPTTAGAYQTSFHGLGGQEGRPSCGGAPQFNTGDAFVSKLNPTGSQLIFSTYLGGKLDDFALAIALDSQQNVYVAGSTLSYDFPVASALQGSFHGSDPQNVFWNFGDAFVAKLSSSGASLIYSTYLGGSGDDVIDGLAAASDGTLWVTGGTTSQDFPVTKDAVQGAYAGYIIRPFNIEQSVGDAFIAHINATGTALLYSTYLGGSQNDMGESIAVDDSGLVYVVGFTDSQNFPYTTNALQKTLAGAGGGGPYFYTGDGFITVLDPTVPRLVYSSYFGGSLDDQLFAVVLDGQGGVWATGGTASTDLPVTPNAAQATLGGSVSGHEWVGDSLLVHFTGVGAAAPTVNSVVNGASFVSGGVAAGEIATIFGVNLTSSSGINFTSGLPLPSAFSNVSVSVNGAPAPLFAVDNVNGQQQINFQVPWEVAGKPTAMIAVTNNTVTGPVVSVPVLDAQPAIFDYSVGSEIFGAILHANFQLADTGHPAKAGEVVLIYCTGLGAVASPPADGSAGDGQVTTVKPSVTMGGTAAPVSFSGLAPGFVGLYQVNAQVPAGLSAGNQAVLIKMGGASSNSVLLPIQ
jgi:uncharacterized protein (TIGR03437 family)